MFGVVLPLTCVAPGTMGNKGTGIGVLLDKQQGEEEKDQGRIVPTGDGRCEGMTVLQDG